MTSNQAVAAGIVGASYATVMIIMLVIWVLLIIARWKIFTKAGEAGWKSIIPVYADYVQWRIGWKKTMLFWVSIGLVVVALIIGVASGALVVNSRGGFSAGPNSGIMSLLVLVCMLVAVVMNLVAIYKLFASFGKGVGFFILYILFPPIMLLVLGFGSAQYQGAQD